MGRTRADVLLVARGLAESRAKARAAIAAGGVTADGRAVLKAADLVADDARLVATPAHPWVGRGALKLEHALTTWPIAVEGRVVLDVGASTGGFTEVCLAAGARRVFAVDVGRGQLHASLAGDPRVVSLEALDARDLTRTQVPQAPSLVVCDVSFIGLAKALPTALGLAASGADLVALVKPQFEVGKGGTDHGVVRDPEAHRRVLDAVTTAAAGLGLGTRAVIASPILGPEGNREFLVHLQAGPSCAEIGERIDEAVGVPGPAATDAAPP